MFTDMLMADYLGLTAIFVAFFLGGILKGATGAGMPIIVVPVIAAVYDVRLAVVILVIPNFLSNVFQIYKFRSYNTEPKFTRTFAIMGLLGAGLGTLILGWAPVDQLNILMAIIVFAYIALKLFKPSFQIPMKRAKKLVGYAGFTGGILQGALGISAPISITFVNAVKLERPVFIFTMSLFFISMTMSQIPLQIAQGMMTWETIVIGLISFIPLMAGMPVGEIIGKRMNAEVFDRVILLMLTVLALKQLVGVLI